MNNMITRKCAHCKDEIVIDKDNLNNILFFNKLYYHTKCFEEMAAKKAIAKRGKPQMWQDALDRLWELEAETKQMLESYLAKDELNMWLLEHYDVVEVPGRFWQMVFDLAAGKYKQKKCKPIELPSLYECWRWGQKKLDEISIANKMNYRGPDNDVDRLRYDLAILITKYPLFLKHKSKTQAIKAVSNFETKQPKIDYSTLASQHNTQNENDILDILDEIF